MSAAKALSLDKAPPAGADPRAPEPSMEDILASIRRIIADDQSRHASANGSSSPARRPPPPPVQAAKPVSAADPIVAPKPLVPPAPPPAADKLSNSIVQARPRTGGDAAAAGATLPHLNAPSVRPDLPVDRKVIDEIASAGVAAALQPARESPVTVASTEPPMTPAAPVSATPEPEPPATVTQSTADLAQDAAPKSAPFEAKVADEPLISSAADASIESSFNALATTVLMQNTGLIENMVRDTLKPMLRQWLESNLPAIVERLVKVEIERVARGGRT